MKKLLLKSFFAISIAISITSCTAIHGGYMTNSAALNSANFSYVNQNIKGQSQATYILGIFGGMEKETLVDDAKKNMLATNPLKSNQTLANITVNIKSSFYFGVLVRTVKCTLTADVVEFK